jgi:hypothetical protein
MQQESDGRWMSDDEALRVGQRLLQSEVDKGAARTSTRLHRDGQENRKSSRRKAKLVRGDGATIRSRRPPSQPD